MKIREVIVEAGLLRRFGDYLDRKGGGKGDWGRRQTANPRSVARDEYLTSLQKLNLEGFIDHFRQQGTYTEKEYRNLGKVAWDRYKVYRDGQGLDPKTAMSNAIADAESGKSITTPAQPAQAPAQTQQPAQTTTSTQVPPAKPGYINTLDIAGVKYWLDARGEWYAYTGNMWPNDILASQKVSDADVDKLAPYIQAGKVKQEPYGPKKKK